VTELWTCSSICRCGIQAAKVGLTVGPKSRDHTSSTLATRQYKGRGETLLPRGGARCKQLFQLTATDYSLPGVAKRVGSNPAPDTRHPPTRSPGCNRRARVDSSSSFRSHAKRRRPDPPWGVLGASTILGIWLFVQKMSYPVTNQPAPPSPCRK